MMIRAVLEQAINLNNIANYARQDAWDASELASTGRSGTHHTLRHLHREVAFRTMDMWKQYERENRLAESRKRRTEKKAAAPPKKRRPEKGEARQAPTCPASIGKSAAPTALAP